MSDRELEHLRRAFLKAETDIINEIARLRSRGLIDYHAVAALQRVQKILKSLEDECWTYVPRMIEKKFYVRHPNLYTRAPKTALEHLTGYINASALTATQVDIVQRLTISLMAEITDASDMCMSGLADMLIGRTSLDIFRRVGLETVINIQATGKGINAPNDFVETLRRDGVTAFVDRAGRKWSLHTYGNMVCRTTSRQAEVLSVLTADPEHDLYMISRHGTTCGKCAPFEGRVFSRSGRDPDFPPLSDAFGKVDPFGPDDISNTWLNIHPNCLHAILPWTPAGRTDEEIESIKAFSNPANNPYDRDPRTDEQIDAYRRKERARGRFLADYRQWERYKVALGDKIPSFQTFEKHKLAADDKYRGWLEEYRKREG